MPLDPHEVQAETVRYLVAKNQELAAEMGYLILTVHSDGWTIRAVDIAVDELATLAEGDEGGDAGKAACEAAYRRACGIPTAPPCAG